MVLLFFPLLTAIIQSHGKHHYAPGAKDRLRDIGLAQWRLHAMGSNNKKHKVLLKWMQYVVLGVGLC